MRKHLLRKSKINVIRRRKIMMRKYRLRNCRWSKSRGKKTLIKKKEQDKDD